MSTWKRQAMIAGEHPGLSLSRRCGLLSISRSSFYYTPKGESVENLALMHRIDELFLNYPFYGSRQMVHQVHREGVRVVVVIARRLMRLRGLEAIYQAPRTSDPHALVLCVNTERPHSALDGRTPAEAHGSEQLADMMDKPDGLPTSPHRAQQQQQQDVINRVLAA